jgi:hypothetical protein
MTRKERTDAMIDLEAELKTLTPEEGYRLYARRLQLWRLCERVSCRRAGACGGDPLSCCRRFADWAEAVKAAGPRERDARDPAVEGLRSEVSRRLRRLAETMRNEKRAP